MKKRNRKPRRSHRAYRRNPSRAGEYDEHAARELELYIDNDSQLHRSSFVPIIANLARKMKKGTYSPALAAKLWAYHIKRGADKYVKEFGTRGDTVGDLGFNKTTRDRLAALYEEANREQVAQEAGVSYKSNPSRRRRHRRNPAPSESRRMGRLGAMDDRLLQAYHAATGDAAKHGALMRLYKLRDIKRKVGDRYQAKRVMTNPTLYDIEQATHATAPHFFDRKTLKFFGQRKSDFKVMRSKKSGRIFIGAPSRTHRGMFTLREFTGKHLRTVSGAPKHWVDVRDWVNAQ